MDRTPDLPDPIDLSPRQRQAQRPGESVGEVVYVELDFGVRHSFLEEIREACLCGACEFVV